MSARRAGFRAGRSLLLALLLLAAATPARVAAQAETQAIGSDGWTVIFWPGYLPVARRTLGALEALPPLPGIPPVRAVLPSTVYLAPTREVFDSVTGGAPEWSAGVAIPSQRVIVVPAYATEHTGTDDPAITLRHEVAHLALHSYVGGRIPRWFDEGYATWASGGFDQSEAWRLRVALLVGSAPPLDSISLRWPRDAGRARLAYLLSASAVQYLAEKGGPRALPRLLQLWRQNGSLDGAVRSVYGLTLGQYEEEWQRMVRRRYGWLLGLSQITVFWALLAVLLLLLGYQRRRYNRARLATLEAEDRMLPPAFTSLDEPPHVE